MPPCLNQGGTVSLSVDLQPGYSAINILSPQKVRKETIGNRHYRITADAASLDSDHDFELTWQPDLGTNPEATVLTEKLGEETYALTCGFHEAVVGYLSAFKHELFQFEATSASRGCPRASGLPPPRTWWSSGC